MVLNAGALKGGDAPAVAGDISAVVRGNSRGARLAAVSLSCPACFLIGIKPLRQTAVLQETRMIFVLGPSPSLP